MSDTFNKPSIIGEFELNSTEKASDSLLDTSAFKVQFLKDENSISPYIAAKFCILTVKGIKVFAGVFSDVNNNEFTLIQIPLLGQTINDLVLSLSSYPDVLAEICNSAGFLSSLLLKDTAFTGYQSWMYFGVESLDINATYSLIDKDLKYYLTTPEPISEQKNLTQSLGGYVSLSEVYRGVSLSESLSIYDNIMYVSDSLSSSFSLLDLHKSEYIQINDEIIKISKWNGNVGYIAERNVFDTPLRMHPKSSVVRELYKNSFFDKKFGEERKQYRCLAIKNTSSTNICKDLKVFLKTK